MFQMNYITRSLCFVFLFGFPVFAHLDSTAAQEEELELIAKVEQYQKQLDADEVAARDKAEQALIKLGPEILDYLDADSEQATTDFRERIVRVRKTLEKVAVEHVTSPSKVTLKGPMTIGDALKKIKYQTRNDVDCTDASQLDIAVELNLEDVDFWTAMNEIMKKSGLRVDRYGNEKPGQIMLGVEPTADQPATKVPSDSAKIFYVEVLRVDSSANLRAPQMDFTTINLLVRWEPRLRPISVDVPMEKVSITDEFGDAIMLADPREVVYGMVQPELPEVEFSIRLPRVDRQIEVIKSLKATIDTVLPGRSEQFRFTKLSKQKPGYKISKAGAHVTFGGTRKNEDVYSVRLSLSFDEDNNALESHQGWVFQNQVYLQDSDGNREEAVSLETLQQDNQRVTVQYYFLEDPGDRTLVYKTAAAIVKMPVKIELNKIPMP